MPSGPEAVGRAMGASVRNGFDCVNTRRQSLSNVGGRCSLENDESLVFTAGTGMDRRPTDHTSNSCDAMGKKREEFDRS